MYTGTILKILYRNSQNWKLTLIFFPNPYLNDLEYIVYFSTFTFDSHFYFSTFSFDFHFYFSTFTFPLLILHFYFSTFSFQLLLLINFDFHFYFSTFSFDVNVMYLSANIICRFCQRLRLIEIVNFINKVIRFMNENLILYIQFISDLSRPTFSLKLMVYHFIFSNRPNAINFFMFLKNRQSKKRLILMYTILKNLYRNAYNWKLTLIFFSNPYLNDLGYPLLLFHFIF